MLERPQPGDYLLRRWHDFSIYAYAYTEQEFLDEERSLGADEEELDYQRKAFKRWLGQGLLWTMAYSVACAQGEYGTTPLRASVKITREEFEQAKAREWTD